MNTNPSTARSRTAELKRSKALSQLSRDHHRALSIATRIDRAIRAGTDLSAVRSATLAAFAADFEPHFQTEESDLFVKLRDAGQANLVNRAVEEHRQLRELNGRISGRDDVALQAFGTLLRKHVRFEERELFPQAESCLGLDDEP